MFTYCPESYDFQTWSTAGDGDYLLDNNAWATNLLSCKLACMAGRAGLDDPSPSKAAPPAILTSSATPLSPAHAPSRSHSRTPTHETERKGLALALHPAPTPRRPNPSPWSPQGVKMVMTVTQYPKRAVSLKKKMKQTLTAEPQVTMKAQVALTGKVLVVTKFQMLMARKKTLMRKPMNPAVRLKGQTLKAAPALQNLMMKFQPKQPHLQRRPQEATPTPPRCFHCLTWTARIPRRNGKFSSAEKPTFCMRNLVSCGNT